ncbi:GTP-binding protein Era [Hyphomonas neptunium ATCC 15444]|uniref:GTPase Era n=2 Tax=Hyphomonas TaxID=85 RepID=Q0C3T8_HYPNA|nr:MULTISPECIES: GTPase Era [Hyphomonas]ABI78099.1 GTP-binding protein Era [Hyphomonas neptunium ATCC 15444]KCZ96184.1 GTPase Era [Hyphomonas hirschiana VP5]
MTETEIRRAGFCAVIGAPNAGKSTLTNRLVGAKVAIVTHKVQTTRFPVRGVAQVGDAQIVIVDTPGIFAAKRRLDRAMVKAAWGGADEADCVVHLVDASAWVAEQTGRPSGAQRHSLEDDRRVIEQLKEAGKRVFLALNKIDLFPHDQVLPVIAALSEAGVYEETFLISAENGEGVDRLEAAIAARMPEGPALYPPDQIADLPMRLLAAEVTREKLMLRLHQELPYQLMVDTESWEERGDGSVRIQQVIIVGRDGHKAMVLGKGGSLIKEIGRLARLDLTQMLERPVHLFLFVKVDERWQEKRERYQGIGLEFDV